ncbi:MAG: hypothetical protein KDD64_09340 [Bdellovibrionales bacterium]|nr:hypothetical protein [Bdellovibrionales bacterium]
MSTRAEGAVHSTPCSPDLAVDIADQDGGLTNLAEVSRRLPSVFEQRTTAGLALDPCGLTLSQAPLAVALADYPESSPLSRAEMQHLRGTIYSFEVSNFKLEFSRLTPGAKRSISGFALYLSDTEGREFGKITVNGIVDEQLSEILQKLLDPDSHHKAPWRSLTVADFAHLPSELIDREGLKPGAKFQVLNGDFLREILKELSEIGGTLRSDFRFPDPEHFGRFLQVQSDVINDICTTYNRYVDVLGEKKVRELRIQERIASTPRIQVMDIVEGCGEHTDELGAAALTKLTARPQGGALRWIDISKPDEEVYRLLKEDLGIDEKVIDFVRKFDGDMRSRPFGNVFVADQHIFRSNKMFQVEDTEMNFIVTPNCVITLHDGAEEVIDPVLLRYKDDGIEEETSTSHSLFLRITRELSRVNEGVLNEARKWVDGNLPNIRRKPLESRRGLADLICNISDSLEKMKFMLEQQSSILDDAALAVGREDATRLENRLEKIVEVQVERSLNTVSHVTNQLQSMRNERRDAWGKLGALSVAGLAAINFASLWSPFVNNHLSIPSTTGQWVAGILGVGSLIITGALTRKYFFPDTNFKTVARSLQEKLPFGFGDTRIGQALFRWATHNGESKGKQ